jgi:hypothetical protein
MRVDLGERPPVVARGGTRLACLGLSHRVSFTYTVPELVLCLLRLALPWAAGGGMTGLPPQPDDNLDQAATSILEPEVAPQALSL